MRLHVNCTCVIGTRLNLNLLLLLKMVFVLELRRTAAATLASLQTNGLKGATTTKAMSFRV